MARINRLLSKNGKGVCHYCGNAISRKGRSMSRWFVICKKTRLPYLKATVDHVVPVCRGGGHSPDNLVAACCECNVRKGNKPLDEFLSTYVKPIIMYVGYRRDGKKIISTGPLECEASSWPTFRRRIRDKIITHYAEKRKFPKYSSSPSPLTVPVLFWLDELTYTASEKKFRAELIGATSDE